VAISRAKRGQYDDLQHVSGSLLHKWRYEKHAFSLAAHRSDDIPSLALRKGSDTPVYLR